MQMGLGIERLRGGQNFTINKIKLPSERLHEILS